MIHFLSDSNKMAPKMFIFKHKVLKLHIFEVLSEFVDDNFRKKMRIKRENTFDSEQIMC